jgi:MFS family permease
MTARPSRFESWQLAYAVLGAVVAGIVPIAVPLAVAAKGNAAHIGTVMAAFNAGSLAAPMWGSVADRARLHRWLLGGGMLALAAGLVVFPLVRQPGAWTALALVMGVAAAAAATVANLFVVEVHPRSEWDARIGWLQTAYGGGQVLGLLISGALQRPGGVSPLWVAAGLTVLGSSFALRSPAVPGHATVPAHAVIRAPRHGEWAAISPQRLYNHLRVETWRELHQLVGSRFGGFLAIWAITTGGSMAVFTLYPVIMQQLFGIAPAWSSPAFAVSAALGMAFYPLAGSWSRRRGTMPVFRFGLALRLVAYAAVGGLAWRRLPGAPSEWLALVPFCATVVAWSFLTVGGTVLAARLCPGSAGAAMGIYNASTGIAGVLGAMAGGAVAAHWGYRWVAAVPVGLIALGLLASLWLHAGAERGVPENRVAVPG